MNRRDLTQAKAMGWSLFERRMYTFEKATNMNLRNTWRPYPVRQALTQGGAKVGICSTGSGITPTVEGAVWDRGISLLYDKLSGIPDRTRGFTGMAP